MVPFHASTRGLACIAASACVRSRDVAQTAQAAFCGCVRVQCCTDGASCSNSANSAVSGLLARHASLECQAKSSQSRCLQADTRSSAGSPGSAAPATCSAPSTRTRSPRRPAARRAPRRSAAGGAATGRAPDRTDIRRTIPAVSLLQKRGPGSGSGSELGSGSKSSVTVRVTGLAHKKGCGEGLIPTSGSESESES